MTILEEIVDAVSMEARVNAKPIDCEVLRTRQVGALWEVWLAPLQMREHLDESLEGATLWWPGPPKGSADILSVVPDEWQINLRFASSPPPPPGGRLKIYSPQFLESLEMLWQDARWVKQCLRVQNALGGFENNCVGSEPHSPRFPWLRTAQQRTFGLTKFEHGFLWGPPGTGKTTTLGALVASYLVQFPRSRILLLSTTNVAVDQALLAVDDALQKIPQLPQDIRKTCQRIGSHFRAALYKDRRHLLPVVDEAALQRLVQLEASRPDPADTRAYDKWKTAVEQARKALRAKAKDILQNA
jgi:hypothetical protein